MDDDDILFGETDKPAEVKPEPRKKRVRAGPGLVGKALTALRDWATWYRLILIAVILLVAHVLWYNRDPVIIDVWGWQPSMPKILAFILFGLIGALAMYVWQHREEPGWGLWGAGEEEEQG